MLLELESGGIKAALALCFVLRATQSCPFLWLRLWLPGVGVMPCRGPPGEPWAGGIRHLVFGLSQIMLKYPRPCGGDPAGQECLRTAATLVKLCLRARGLRPLFRQGAGQNLLSPRLGSGQAVKPSCSLGGDGLYQVGKYIMVF